MDHRQALNETLTQFDLKAAAIAEAAGIDAGRLSKFRNGHHDLRSSALQQIINALPEKARAYYYLLLMSNGHKIPSN